MADVQDESASAGNKKRFASVNDEEYKRILKEKDAINTCRITDSAVKLQFQQLNFCVSDVKVVKALKNFPLLNFHYSCCY